MLLGAYASDSDSGSDTEAPPAPARVVAASKSTAAVKPVPAAGAGGAGAPAKAKKRTGPIKITLDLPKVSAGSDEEGRPSRRNGSEGGESDDETPRAGREAKRVKLGGGGGGGLKGGAGSYVPVAVVRVTKPEKDISGLCDVEVTELTRRSSLLGMLPAPKRKLPTSAAPKATLGGGASAGDKKSSLSVNRNTATSAPAAVTASTGISLGLPEDDEDEEDGTQAGPSSLLPASMARKAAKAGKGKKQEEELDLFGLGSSSTSTSAPKPTTSLLPPTSSISSAPAVADFVPPPPTASDPYPGYYQLPSGQWAAYEPDYYHSFFPSSAVGVESEGGDRGDGRKGHGWNDFRAREADMLDVHASEGLAEAREAEERRAMRAKPKIATDDFVYQAVGATKGVAADRHQLSSLLNSAYTQREALEEQIANNKKNSRVARTKYGF